MTDGSFVKFVGLEDVEGECQSLSMVDRKCEVEVTPRCELKFTLEI